MFDLSLVRSSDIHLGAISQEIHQLPITRIRLNIAKIKFDSYIPGVNELTDVSVKQVKVTGDISVQHNPG